MAHAPTKTKGAKTTKRMAKSHADIDPRKLHTLANSGPGIMRVLGVFRPAGSPAAAFYPDGTPASYVAAETPTASISS